MKQTVYFLGNELEKKDRMPLLIIHELRKTFPQISFVHLDPTEDFIHLEHEKVIIIDTVINIEKTTVFTELHMWSHSPHFSVHDFDLPVSLGILHKLGKIKSITIIGIPPIGNRRIIQKEVISQLKSISS
jgi:hypothetical protein